jgi:hypothetical protein
MINLINNYYDNSIQNLNKISNKTKLKKRTITIKENMTLWDILTMCVIDGLKGFYLYKDCYQNIIDQLKKWLKKKKY